VDDLQTGGKHKYYSFEDICPNPFDRTLYKPPFPKNFETPKFDKYKGKGDPRDHLREFYIACLEVSNNDTYLMRLFPRSLSGQAAKWFAHLPPGIRTFPKLAEKFVNHFSYNFEHEVSMTNLCNTKQKSGEAFASFLQRWRGLASKLPWPIPEKQLVTMFVANLNQELGFHLQILCTSTFEEVIDKGTTIERALIAKGSIKLFDHKSNNNNHNNNNNNYKSNHNTPNTNNNTNTQSNDKSRYWGKNKNNLNDGVTDVKAVQHIQN